MTVLKTAYDTLSGKIKDAVKTEQAIERAVVGGALSSVNKIIEIDRVKNKEIEEIPALLFPKVMLLDEEERVVVDMRYYLGVSTGLQDRKVLNKNEYEFAKYWASFQYRWISENPTNLRVISPVALATYANWLSDSIIKRLTLDPRESIPVRVVCAYYYVHQFQDEDLDAQTKNNMFRMISRALNLPVDLVIELLDNSHAIHSLDDFCEALQTIVGSVRLQKLTPGFLLALVQGSWFGVNAREIVAAALEHPPTWLALMCVALNNRIYKSTAIMKAIERSTPRNNLADVGLSFKRSSGVEKYFE